MSSAEIDFLKGFATEERIELFERIVQDRSHYLTVVLEDIYQAQNASAVLRSCDCFGIQDVHVIENTNEFVVHRDISMGSAKWLNIHQHNQQKDNTLAAINKLKSEGYRIVATSPHANDVNLEQLDLEAGKCALVFGTELTGISDVVKENADEFLTVPMYGFTESFNISVCAALVLHHLTHRLRNSEINWQLTEQEREKIMLEWLKRSVKSSDRLLETFHAKE